MRIIRGKYGRRRFDVPKNISARPTTDFARENIFNVIENIIDIEDKKGLDLFAGTGAVSFELLSRGCESVTSVEKANTQHSFIRGVSQKLGATNHCVVKGDVFRWVGSASSAGAKFDIVFADPPYDMDNFDDVVPMVLGSGILAPGGLFIMEHSGKRDYSHLPECFDHRSYGSVNFSLFRAPEAGEAAREVTDQ